MPTAIIEAKYVNKPDKNPNFGSIRTPDGTYYGFPREMLSDFREGGIYEIFYETKQGRTGKEFHTIKTAKPHESRTAPAAARVLAQAERARTPETESKQIFVCALLVAGINSGQVNILTPSDLLVATENAIRAREYLLSNQTPSPKTNSQVAPEPDDMEDYR